MEKKHSTDGKMKVYEIGYLLVPTIAEENVPAEVENMKAALRKHDVEVITEDFPKLRPLSYSMKKQIGGEWKKFDKAYFGWVKFETSPLFLSEIKKDLDKNEHVLRHLLIETVRENTLVSQRIVFRPQADGDKAKGEEKEKMTEEEMEKTIENLVVE